MSNKTTNLNCYTGTMYTEKTEYVWRLGKNDVFIHLCFHKQTKRSSKYQIIVFYNSIHLLSSIQIKSIHLNII